MRKSPDSVYGLGDNYFMAIFYSLKFVIDDLFLFCIMYTWKVTTYQPNNLENVSKLFVVATFILNLLYQLTANNFNYHCGKNELLPICNKNKRKTALQVKTI